MTTRITGRIAASAAALLLTAGLVACGDNGKADDKMPEKMTPETTGSMEMPESTGAPEPAMTEHGDGGAMMEHPGDKDMPEKMMDDSPGHH